MGDDAVVTCSLNRDELADRRTRWDRLAERAFVERETTTRGQQLAFRNEPGVEAELRELAELERECCAFADWTVGEAGGRVVLEISSSSDEAVAAVQAMLSRLPGCRAPR